MRAFRFRSNDEQNMYHDPLGISTHCKAFVFPWYIRWDFESNFTLQNTTGEHWFRQFDTGSLALSQHYVYVPFSSDVLWPAVKFQQQYLVEINNSACHRNL